MYNRQKYSSSCNPERQICLCSVHEGNFEKYHYFPTQKSDQCDENSLQFIVWLHNLLNRQTMSFQPFTCLFLFNSFWRSHANTLHEVLLLHESKFATVWNKLLLSLKRCKSRDGSPIQFCSDCRNTSRLHFPEFSSARVSSGSKLEGRVLISREIRVKNKRFCIFPKHLPIRCGMFLVSSLFWLKTWCSSKTVWMNLHLRNQVALNNKKK